MYLEPLINLSFSHLFSFYNQPGLIFEMCIIIIIIIIQVLPQLQIPFTIVVSIYLYLRPIPKCSFLSSFFNVVNHLQSLLSSFSCHISFSFPFSSGFYSSRWSVFAVLWLGPIQYFTYPHFKSINPILIFPLSHSLHLSPIPFIISEFCVVL